MKDTVVVCSSNVEKWGAERSVYSMCDILHKSGIDVLVILPRIGEITKLLDDISIDYLVMPCSPWCYEKSKQHRRIKGILSLWQEYKQRKRIIGEVKKRCNPILVYSSTILFQTGMQCAKHWKVPHILHCRENIDAFGYKMIFGYKWSMRYIRNHTSMIICTCDAIKKRYEGELNNTPISVIHNGVPLINHIDSPIISGVIQMVQVARFMDDKRVIDSLHAMKYVIDSGRLNIHLDLYGYGPEENLYLKYIEENRLDKYVSIKGFADKIDFGNYNIGLMTSKYEAFARTTLDYMNNGLAVIASKSGGNVEQVNDNITGLLYDTCNAKSLAKTIIRLYDNQELIGELGKNGRKRFISEFTQDIYQQKILNVFQLILNRRNKSL